MCTAISLKTNDHYFGRNLDLEYSNQEKIIITPRKYLLDMRKEKPIPSHFAMIGIGIIIDQYPLYYDATNEHGLSMAGLNFPYYACYHPYNQSKHNITPFELIPWILGQCKTVKEAIPLLDNTNIVNTSFNEQYPLSPLHWMLSDSSDSLVVETMKNGLHITNNPIGVLTNSPDFPYHINNLSNYMNLSADEITNQLSPTITLNAYSRGMGAFGLPGDLSSSSRFVRAAFTKLNSVCDHDDASSVSQFFHILSVVSQTSGCVKVSGKFEKTVYSSCCNTTKGIYYYKTYDNHQITAVDLFHENLNQSSLIKYKMRWNGNIHYEN